MYFKALQRAYNLKNKVVHFRKIKLMSKVFESFRKKKEFVELKIQMREICHSKYEDNLIAKSFDLLYEYANRKR